MRRRVSQHTIAAFVALFVVAPVAWMAMDREPPHVRESGEIIAVAPQECGLAEDSRPSGFRPGSCVKIKWNIIPRRKCLPSTEYNVERWILAAGQKFPMPSISSEQGPVTKTLGLIARPFLLPLNLPEGRASYGASACFTCNPTHYLKPVCVTNMEIPFQVEKP